MTDRAQKIMDAFYFTFADKRQDFIIQKLNNDALANALRAVVSLLQYDNADWQEPNNHMIIDVKNVLELVNELEALK
jgi:hypothetical protein